MAKRIQFSWHYSTGIAERVGHEHWRLTGHVCGEEFPAREFFGPDAEQRCTYRAFRAANACEAPPSLSARKGDTLTGLQAVLTFKSVG